MLLLKILKKAAPLSKKQAELLKIKFGSAWPGENKDNEIVSIPGLRGREPKEITLKNLSKIIHARVVEIIEQVYLEIKNYGHDDQKKKLIAGIVLTGGGAQLKHIKQLVEYITGMDTRIGYPNEHLAGDSDAETTSPLYATAVGLVLNSLEIVKKQPAHREVEEQQEDGILAERQEPEEIEEPMDTIRQPRKTFFEKWVEKFKEFLEKAE